MIEAAFVRTRGWFASFRDPLAHTYQRTFPLPPPTTLTGLLGAALGVAPEEADRLDVGVSVYRVRTATDMECQRSGRALDLWKYRKYKNGAFDTSAVLTRELLYRHDYDLYYLPHSGVTAREKPSKIGTEICRPYV